MDETQLAELIRTEMARIGGDVNAGFGAAKQRMAELGARLTDVEQRSVRKGGGGNDEPLNAGKNLGDAADPLVKGLKDANSARTELAISVKALSSTALGATGSTQYAVPLVSLGPVDTYHSPAVRLLDLLPGQPVTEGNAITYVRVSYAVAGNVAKQTPELTDKAESALATEPVTAEIPTWAHYVSTSRQVVADVSGLRGLIDSLLTRGLLDKVDAGAFTTLTGSGNFTAYVPTVGDAIGDAVARIAAQVVNQGGRDVVVALNPADYLTMQLAKAVSSGDYLGMPPTLASRVAAVASVAPGNILAFAPVTGAAFADRQAVVVEAGYTGSGFTQNKVTLLAEARGMAFVRDPAHVAYGALPAAA